MTLNISLEWGVTENPASKIYKAAFDEILLALDHMEEAEPGKAIMHLYKAIGNLQEVNTVG